ncbi:outer membrane lipoprotein-sorting protein [Hyalangium gracile]|uniref:outer membrane lipoprotein-sorting protein n=1 Tax=Hyalangium gracile TaxID=394092 RepID=UPI001CCE5BB2|nr:outer membrane lipoprotein-sorting protein [Hyalangium gracile]
MVDKFYGAIVRGRWLVIALSVAVMAVYLGAVGKLRVDGSSERSMVRNDPDRKLHEEVRKIFGGDEVMLIVLTEEAGIYQLPYLEKIDRVTRKIEQLALVEDVYSLTNNEVLTGENGELRFPELMDKVRKEGWTLDQVREHVLKDPFLLKNVVSEDGKMTAINVRVTHDIEPLEMQAKKKELLRGVNEIVSAEFGAGKYFVTGWPSLQVDIAQTIEKDLGRLLPLAFLAITVMLLFAFGRPAGVLLPVLGVILSLLATMGNLQLVGKTISMLTNTLPLMIIAVGTTFGVYVMSAIFQALQEEKDRHAAVRSAISHTASGIFLSALTTAIGFLSLTFNDIEAISEFGYFAAAGVICSAIVSVVIIPALAAVLPLKARAPSKLALLGRRLHPVRLLPTLLSGGGRRVATISTVVMIAASAYGVTRMRVESDPISWFPKSSEPYQRAMFVNENMVGISPYSIVIESPEEGGLQEPAVLKKIEALQQYLVGRDDIDTSLSYVDYVKLMTQALHDGDAAKRVIPDTRPEIAQTMLLYESDGLDTMVTKDYRKANILLRSHIVRSELGVKMVAEVNDYLKTHFAGMGLTARITGTPYLYSKSNIVFTSGLAQNLMLSIGLIGIVMMIVARSIRLGLLALFPNVLPIAFNYALLGWTGLTLNSGTSITGCIAMGMAVDDTIHFITAFRDRLSATGDVRKALEEAMELVGQPMLVNAVCLTVGFSMFLLSGFEPITVLGMLVAITMTVAVLCELMLMPNLLTAVGPWLLKGIKVKPAQAASNVVHAVPATAPQAEVSESKGGSAKALVLLLGLGYALAPSPAAAEDLTAQQIIDRLTNNNSTGFKQGKAEMRLVLQGEAPDDKRERRYTLTTVDVEGKTKNLIRFVAPAEVQGSAFLTIEHGQDKEDELFVYLPALKRTRRISGAQKSGAFMGSDVSYADITYEDVENATHQKQADAKLEGVDCYQLVATPKDTERYSKIELWVRKDNFLAQQMKMYDKSGNLHKVFRLIEVKNIDGKAIATKSQVWDKQKKHTTFFLIDSVDLKTAQNAGDFTPERMASN